LQLQNNSALGVEVNPEAIHALYNFKNISLFNFGDGIWIST